MFDAILQHSDLFAMSREVCEENNIGIELSKSIAEEKFLILKPDAYYNSLRMHNPPPSVDCVIIVGCETDALYDFYLVELRNVDSPRGVKTKDIEAKFATVINKFLEEDFADIFVSDDYSLNNFQLYLVTDAYHLRNFSETQYAKRILSIEKERELFQKIFKFKDKLSTIRLKQPSAVIEKC